MILRYPKKSHRKTVQIPQDSTDLAELMGIELGDGGINNPWQLVITLNSIADLEYSKYVAKLLQGLFEISVYVRKRPGGNRLVLVCSSTNLVDFLVSRGAIRGNKIKQQIDVPGWIMKNKKYQRAFVRGLVDTDGCLYIHRHTVQKKEYCHLGFCFTSYSLPLIKSVSRILQGENITPHFNDKGRRIFLYDKNSVIQYLKIFGSSNPRITRKFSEWEKSPHGCIS